MEPSKVSHELFVSLEISFPPKKIQGFKFHNILKHSITYATMITPDFREAHLLLIVNPISTNIHSYLYPIKSSNFAYYLQQTNRSSVLIYQVSWSCPYSYPHQIPPCLKHQILSMNHQVPILLHINMSTVGLLFFKE